jgi:hypothetical protein
MSAAWKTFTPMLAPHVANSRSLLTYVRPGRNAGSYVFSALACLAVVFFFMLSDEDCQHWFVVPVFLCGVLVGVDAIDWLRSKVDVLDPKGVLGIFGVHFFFVAPLLHVRLNMWMWDVDPTPDWRPWLGKMAFLNFLGLLIYRCVVWHLSERSMAPVRPARAWKPKTRTLMTLLLSAICAGTAIQVLIYAAFGGIGGFIAAVQDRHFSFLGDTWAMMLAGRVPYLAVIAMAVYWRSRNYVPSLALLAATLLGFIVLQLLFGGLRGERSDIVYALFVAVGVLHYWIRPLTKTMVFAGLGFLVVFMYVYGFYKFGGSEGLKAMTQGAEQRASMEEDFHHSFTASLLGDLGRADMQAYVLYRLSRPENDFPLAFGRTYFGSAITVLPGPLWRDRPPSKVKEVWDVLYGARTFEQEFGRTAFSDRIITTRIFGLAGETMTNFGPYSVPFGFLILGACVGWSRRRIAEWRVAGDSRLLLAPLLTMICLTVLQGDSDNVIFYFQMSGAVPFAIIFFGSQRGSLSPAAPLRVALSPASAT